MSFSRIVLASHGTPGARAAEQAALGLCAADGLVLHLLVVPEFWSGMMGDDWLNNAATRDTFGRYVENRLDDEAQEQIDRVRSAADERGLVYQGEVRFGRPDECLLAFANEAECDLVVMGARRRAGAAGLRSQMASESLFKSLRRPLLVVPATDG